MRKRVTRLNFNFRLEMRVSLVRLANTSSKAPLNLNAGSAMLFPPIPLYRRLLRAHRHLPSDMRSLGDDYVKSGMSSVWIVENK